MVRMEKVRTILLNRSAYADNDLEANALRDYLNQNKNRKDENNEF